MLNFLQTNLRLTLLLVFYLYAALLKLFDFCIATIQILNQVFYLILVTLNLFLFYLTILRVAFKFFIYFLPFNRCQTVHFETFHFIVDI